MKESESIVLVETPSRDDHPVFGHGALNDEGTEVAKPSVWSEGTSSDFAHIGKVTVGSTDGTS